ncbi:MAG: hypothetical protein COB71_02845 [Thiotrichales bacterium]|nr:MAG: hypothetical protein COB71_02845 [Thiotrichales bacterium]
MESQKTTEIDLLTATIALAVAVNHPNITQMCRDLNVSPKWYYRLLADKGVDDKTDYGIKRVQRLRAYLLAYRTAAAA